jgi:hypothetical protein
MLYAKLLTGAQKIRAALRAMLVSGVSHEESLCTDIAHDMV